MRVNKEIKAESVRVVTEEGQQLGILSVRQALDAASERGKDLVEISPNAKPPVCKIIDFGKFKYQQTKKEKESKKAQHQVKVKEIKLRPNINIHDLTTKLNHARDFILKGDKVRVVCMFRGRQMLHIDLGEKVVKKIIEDLKEIAGIETPIKLMGRNLSVVLAPLSKSARQKMKKESASAENENK